MTPALPRRDYAPAAQGPLAGLRVLDLSRLFAGNLLTQVLGDFGAEVIKVEPPEGDTLRAWRTEGVATHWKIYARNKKSLCLDLRRAPASSSALPCRRPPCWSRASGRACSSRSGSRPRRCWRSRASSSCASAGPIGRARFGTLVEGMSGFAAINGFADREPVLPPMYSPTASPASTARRPP